MKEKPGGQQAVRSRSPCVGVSYVSVMATTSGWMSVSNSLRASHLLNGRLLGKGWPGASDVGASAFSNAWSAGVFTGHTGEGECRCCLESPAGPAY